MTKNKPGHNQHFHPAFIQLGFTQAHERDSRLFKVIPNGMAIESTPNGVGAKHKFYQHAAGSIDAEEPKYTQIILKIRKKESLTKSEMALLPGLIAHMEVRSKNFKLSIQSIEKLVSSEMISILENSELQKKVWEAWAPIISKVLQELGLIQVNTDAQPIFHTNMAIQPLLEIIVQTIPKLTKDALDLGVLEAINQEATPPIKHNNMPNVTLVLYPTVGHDYYKEIR